MLVFSGAFTETLNKVIDIVELCQSNLVFTEELYNLATGETWGIATYIPLDSNLQMVAPFINEEGVNGFLVIKILTDSASAIAISGEVTMTGNAKYYNEVREVEPNLSLITDNFYTRVDYNYDSEFYIVTDSDYIVLYISTTSLLSNYDYIVNLKTTTAAATWKIRRNGLEYQKFVQLLKEIKK